MHGGSRKCLWPRPRKEIECHAGQQKVSVSSFHLCSRSGQHWHPAIVRATLSSFSTGPGLWRIFEAREAVRQAIPPISKLRKLGLVVYGPSETDECGVSLEFPPIADAAPRIVNTIDSLQPTGSTPIDEAVQLAAETLENNGDVVLVTDGKETCGGSPCQLASKFAAEEGGLTVHVIGFKVRGDHFSWSETLAGDTQAETVAKCLADQTAGHYVTAETLEQLVTAFWLTLGCAPVS